MSSQAALQEDQLLELLLQLKVRFQLASHFRKLMFGHHAEDNTRASSRNIEQPAANCLCVDGRDGQRQRRQYGRHPGTLTNPVLETFLTGPFVLTRSHWNVENTSIIRRTSRSTFYVSSATAGGPSQCTCCLCHSSPPRVPATTPRGHTDIPVSTTLVSFWWLSCTCIYTFSPSVECSGRPVRTCLIFTTASSTCWHDTTCACSSPGQHPRRPEGMRSVRHVLHLLIMGCVGRR